MLCYGVPRIFLISPLSCAAVVLHRGQCEKLLRSVKLATSSLSINTRWGDVARYVLECVVRAGYRDGVLNEEQLQRLLGYDTRLQVQAFLQEQNIPLRP